MSGECDKCGEHALECFCCCLIKRIESIGRARECLKNLIYSDIFQNISKHDPYWQSEHETEGDKLDDLRLKISFLHDKLWDLMSILQKDE